MSKIIELAQIIDSEINDLQLQIENVNCRTYRLEEELQREKAKNRSVAAMLRELADRIEREEN